MSIEDFGDYTFVTSKHSHNKNRFISAYDKMKVVIVAFIKSKGINGTVMNKALDITDIADWFLSKESMTHKKLQKICYYAVAWGWALLDRSIAERSEFQAWVHGPVSSALYDKYKNNGWNNLNQPDKVVNTSDDVAQLLESVWATYGDKGGNELEALSHIEQPWKNARVGAREDERSTNAISVDDMKKYYKSIYQGDD